jgi:nitroreductase
MDVIEAIKTRRSIRSYRQDPVSEKDLTIIMEAARWAPSWANTQCARWIVVTDSKTKSQLAETLSPNNPSKAAMTVVPIVIVACAELKKSGYTYKGEQVATDKGDWFMFDVALTIQNLTLAAHALGLGTVHIGLFDAAKAARILSVPEGFAVVEIIPVGYPAMEGKAPQRKELTETLFYENWGNTKQHIVT